MLDWSHLLLPALYSAIAIFIVSTVIHVALKYHNSDFHKFGNEDEVRAAIRKANPAPGMYMLPHCSEGGKQDPAVQQKFVEGPIGLVMLRPAGPIQMGPFLGKWFVYCFVVALLSGYVAHFTLPVPAQSYGQVFRLVGTVAWLAFAWAGPADSIWMGKPWSSTIKHMIDGLVYGLLTAGCFAWQWPHGGM
jgi:hypothetical protein